MPELPEVEFGRRVAESVALGRTIERVRCERDPIVFEKVSARRWSTALNGRTVLQVRRWGKQLWFELDQPPHPLFHFGMTGAFRVRGEPALKLASSRKRAVVGEDEQWPPRFTKIHLWFDDGGELVMTNARRLGRLRLRDEPMEEPPLSRLGFDPLMNLPTPKSFAVMLAKRKTPMKALLLDQTFAAGVGNWIADEVLYRAKIDPRRRADSLSAAEARGVRKEIKHVIERAVAVDADKKRLPRTWLFHRRWGKNDGGLTVKGERISFLEVGGRTTAWVPEVQK